MTVVSHQKQATQAGGEARMAQIKGSGPRPLKVFVKYASKAEAISRKHAAQRDVEARRPAAMAAAGFGQHPELNLRDRAGKIITDLVFTNFFVGGDAGWSAQDRNNIDQSLAKAMSDQNLNNVMLQYFRGAPSISSTFRPSTVIPDSAQPSLSQPDIEQIVTQLNDNGQLGGFDLGNSVFNFMLPRGKILTIDGASSLEGLGGFHGAVQAGGVRVYYAVGVFSEGGNGIVAFDQSWKNVVATFYHELNEARTDADVEQGQVAWVNDEAPSAEIGDIPMELAGGNLGSVMVEVPLTDDLGTVPIQLMWSNAVAAPEGPIPAPHPPPAIA
jgi:hypothetical protein